MKNQHTHGPEYRNHITEFSDKSAKGNKIEYMRVFLPNNALITIITMQYIVFSFYETILDYTCSINLVKFHF